MTDLFSALVECNIVLRRAGWIIPALIQVIFNRGTTTRARVIEIFLLYNSSVGGMITATSISFILYANKCKRQVIPVLTPYPTCGATMDLKRWKYFASRHISDNGKLYYCNDPIYPPDEW